MITNSRKPILCGLLYFFCFFPYLQLVPLGTDSQPYALLVAACIVLIAFNGKLSHDLFALLCVFVFSVAWAFATVSLGFNTIKSILNYATFFFVTYAVEKSLERTEGLSLSLFSAFVWIWFIVGFVQLFIDHSFMTFLIPRGDVKLLLQTGRGVLSLAPEPTYYGIVCVLMLLVNNLNFKGRKSYMTLNVVLAFQLVFLSRSSLTLFILIGALCLYFIARYLFKASNLKNIIVIVLVIIGLDVFFTFFFAMMLKNLEGNRFGDLIEKLTKDPLLFVTADKSVNERFIHLFFPIYACITNYGMPHEYGSFQAYIAGVKASGDFSKYILEIPNSSRIMSGLGSALYELGIMAMALPVVICRNYFILIKRDDVHLFFFLLFFGILLNAMPLSNGIVPFVMGNIMYKVKHETNLLGNLS